jgi:peroxiredoxin
VTPPDDYFSFSKELPLQNEQAIASMYYFLFLRSYFTEVWEPENQKIFPDSGQNVQRLKDLVLYSQSKFSPYISDILLAMELDMLIDLNNISEDKYSILIEAINDEALKKYLKSHYINREILKPGDDAPGFYLKNIDNEYFSLADFKDSIIYLSFWSTGCKPCLKEIPEENRLVGFFNNEKVKIINICMSSTEESWRNVTEKYQLKTINLFATGNWEKILEKSYDIKSFPHYVIIDKNGRIIENKTIRPGNGAEQKIKRYIGN